MSSAISQERVAILAYLHLIWVYSTFYYLYADIWPAGIRICVPILEIPL